MRENKINILSTRPVGKVLIDEATSHGVMIDEISFIETEQHIDKSTEERVQQLLNKNINVVFTSMNAVNAVSQLINGRPPWKIFCIGSTTNLIAAKIFGEKNIADTADNALSLAEKIVSTNAVSKVYFFCGDIRRDELPEKLKANNIDVEEIRVYKTVFTPKKIVKTYDGILFFSPSAVESFFQKNDSDADTKYFAIGKTTADSLRTFTSLPIVVADKPGKKNLVQEAIRYFCSHN